MVVLLMVVVVVVVVSGVDMSNAHERFDWLRSGSRLCVYNPKLTLKRVHTHVKGDFLDSLGGFSDGTVAIEHR